MPIQFQSREKNDANAILLAFPKDRPDTGLVKQYTGISYVPDFSLAAKEVTQFFHPDKQLRIWVLGLGEKADVSKQYLFYRSILVQQRTKMEVRVTVPGSHLTDDELTHAVIGLRMGLLNHGSYRTNGSRFVEPDVRLILDKKQMKTAQAALHIAEAQIAGMALVDMPANIKTPAFIAEKAKETGRQSKFSVKVMEAGELRKKGMHALLAVGQGSANPPALLVMEYKPKGSGSGHPVLGLVGKGICFDTGGISIKPSANMANMKSDMAGAAAVLGSIDAAARLELPIHVVGVVPLAENSVDAMSIRPGDVISSYSGKSIEVIDTDAEGRLILADGLSYLIRKHKPEQIIDLATLTGSCIATLGNAAAGMFTHNDSMAEALVAAGEKVNEKVWRLPLWEEYASEMHSDIADIKNLSTKPVAGAITAAKFLEFFTENHTAWTHLDIAGVAFTDSEFARSKTATGYGVRLLLAYMQHLIGQKKKNK